MSRKMEGLTYKVEKATENQVISQKTSSGEGISVINHLKQDQPLVDTHRHVFLGL